MAACVVLFAGSDSSLDSDGAGAVVFVDVKELKEVRRVGMPKHAAAVKWHSQLNQIFVGVGEYSTRQNLAELLYASTDDMSLCLLRQFGTLMHTCTEQEGQVFQLTY